MLCAGARVNFLYRDARIGILTRRMNEKKRTQGEVFTPVPPSVHFAYESAPQKCTRCTRRIYGALLSVSEGEVTGEGRIRRMKYRRKHKAQKLRCGSALSFCPMPVVFRTRANRYSMSSELYIV